MHAPVHISDQERKGLRVFLCISGLYIGLSLIHISRGTDSVDFALVNRLSAGDVVVTQDYGLAAMCLAKGAAVLRQDGLEYTAENIDALLSARAAAQKIRRAGGRLKGPAKRTREEDRAFEQALDLLLARLTGKEDVYKRQPWCSADVRTLSMCRRRVFRRWTSGQISRM